jgi:hypothetical protein
MAKSSPYYRKKTSYKPPKRKSRTYTKNDYASQWYASPNWRSRTDPLLYGGFSEDTIRRQLCDLLPVPEYGYEGRVQEYGGTRSDSWEGVTRVEGQNGGMVEVEYKGIYGRVLDGEGCCWHHEPWMGWVWCCGLTCWMPKPLLEGREGYRVEYVDEAGCIDGATLQDLGEYCGVKVEDRNLERSGDGETRDVGIEEGDKDVARHTAEHSNCSSIPELSTGLIESEGASLDMDSKAALELSKGETYLRETAEDSNVTEETGGAKIELCGRDDWSCDFCGLECFCWTVDVAIRVKASLR